jgi:hypothetical protein
VFRVRLNPCPYPSPVRMGSRSTIENAFAGHHNMWVTLALQPQMWWSWSALIVAQAGTPDRTAACLAPRNESGGRQRSTRD